TQNFSHFRRKFSSGGPNSLEVTRGLVNTRHVIRYSLLHAPIYIGKDDMDLRAEEQGHAHAFRVTDFYLRLASEVKDINYILLVNITQQYIALRVSRETIYQLTSRE